MDVHFMYMCLVCAVTKIWDKDYGEFTFQFCKVCNEVTDHNFVMTVNFKKT